MFEAAQLNYVHFTRMKGTMFYESWINGKTRVNKRVSQLSYSHEAPTASSFHAEFGIGSLSTCLINGTQENHRYQNYGAVVFVGPYFCWQPNCHNAVLTHENSNTQWFSCVMHVCSKVYQTVKDNFIFSQSTWSCISCGHSVGL